MKRCFILLSLVSLLLSVPMKEYQNTVPRYIEILKCFLNQKPLMDN